ncbi:hypothetical protein AMS58_06210 [Pseudoalteromonas porphyrae]|uniref:diguanylate cyclase domain-containing protein n=1 Tax=Pseudoalteromonas porphyrae TaxID=187330 RepID=UPI0006BAFCFB|nr:diguanylate cyclase [Pseudoalteromonas porphyrae]KPH95769.1 hypothetical protein AMS58_06210 [Pseudoalteromonas porphyrae]
MNILHVEDNQPYARLIMEELNDAYTDKEILLTNAATIEEVKNLIKEGFEYDLILLDLSLPDAKEFDAIKMLRKIYKSVPIIVLSGAGQRKIGLQSVSLGAQDYLMKDEVTTELLLKSIEYAIERNRTEQNELISAMTDPLTNLPNRAYFLECLTASAERAKRSHLSLILLFIDFDGFKKLNDTHGHKEGDNFLIEIGKRLKKLVRKSDLCARFGGDEFLILVETKHESVSLSVPFFDKLLDIMRVPFKLATGENIFCRCSVGISLFDPNLDSTKPVDELINEADEAMYKAKKEGGDCFRLHESLLNDEDGIVDNQYVNFRRCLDREDYFLSYQPIISAENEKLVGLECELKSNNISIGSSESPFFCYLKATNLVIEIGTKVIEKSVNDFIQFTNEHQCDDVFLLIKVSILQFKQPGFIVFVKRQLERSEKVGWLNFEVTMQDLLEETIETLEILSQLRGLGIKITIDKFAVGCCNLSSLLEVPVDFFKFSKTFTQSAVQSSNKLLVAEAVIQLALKLKKEVIISGVKDKKMADKFLSLGAQYMQGEYISSQINEKKVQNNNVKTLHNFINQAG